MKMKAIERETFLFLSDFYFQMESLSDRLTFRNLKHIIVYLGLLMPSLIVLIASRFLRKTHYVYL